MSTADLLAAAGIEVTSEGLARARRELDEVAKGRTPERTNALRARLGCPPPPAAG